MVDTQAGLLAGRRVLVVEDQYFLADDITASLDRLGAAVVGPLPSLTEALAAVRVGQPIDAAVLDVNLRDGMCFPVIEELRARRIPFVLATGYDQTVLPPGYESVPHWLKPFNPDQLVRALPKLIAND